MPEEIWTEVHNTVQKTVAKTIPRKKKCKKAQLLSKEALQIAEEKRNERQGLSSVAQSCLTLCNPWTSEHHQASLSITNSQNLLKLMSIVSVMPLNHLILCRPLLLPPSIFPSIKVFSYEMVLHIR